MRGLVAGFDRLTQVVAGLLVVLLLLSVSAGVVTRALGDPLAWTDEAARMLMVWLAMTGWILSTRRGLHVRIKFFQDLLPRPMGRGLEVVIQAGTAVLGVLAAWYGVELVERNFDLEATSLPISIAWMYAPLIPAGVVTAVQAGAEMVAAMRGPGAPGMQGAR